MHSLSTQSELRSISIQQQACSDELSGKLIEQTDLVRLNHEATENHTKLVRDDIATLQATFSPSGIILSQLSSLPQVLDSVSRLVRTFHYTFDGGSSLPIAQEAKVDNITPDNASQAVLAGETAELDTLRNDFRKMARKVKRHMSLSGDCGCRPHSDIRTYSCQPLSLTHTQRRYHSRHCPFSVFDNFITQVELRLSICSVSLGSKTSLSITLFRDSRVFSLRPALACRHTVTNSSPGFQLIASMVPERTHFNENPRQSEIFLQGSKNLFELFHSRKCSPHDQLSNGMTLLHVSPTVLHWVIYDL